MGDATGGWRFAAAITVAALTAAACGTPDPVSAPPPGRSGVVAELAAASDRACSRLPLAERAGRVLVVGLPHVTEPDDPLVAEVLEVGVGGVLLTHVNVESTTQVRTLTSSLLAAARRPLVIATDEEPGRVTSFSALFGDLPSARRLAASSTAAEVRETATRLGRNLAGVGITVDLAPVADLDDGPAFGLVGDRSFSSDPLEASAYAMAWARGMAAAGVTPVTKHFPGHGRTEVDTHVEAADVAVSLTELRATDLRPFADAIAAGAPAIMVGHVAYRAFAGNRPASLNPRVYAYLREMGFEGVALTDSIGMGAVNLRWDFDEAAVEAVIAGADGVLATDGTQARRMRDALVEAVRTGRLPAERLDRAAARMAALAGADPWAVACIDLTLPVLTGSSTVTPARPRA